MSAEANSLLERLRARVASVRSRLVLVAAAGGVSWLVIGAVLVLGAAMAGDWLFELPREARGLLLLAYLIWGGRVLWTRALRPLLRQPGEDEVALLVERGMPDFRGRLIASLQLSRASAVQPGESAVWVDELVRQTEAMAAPRRMGDVVAVDRLASAAAFALILLAMGATLVWHFREASVPLLQRVLLMDVPVPRQTQVTIEQPELVIVRGEDAEIVARVTGRQPASGRLIIRYEQASDDVRRQLSKSEGDLNASVAEYRHVEANVHQSFQYTVRINDGRARGRVSVVPRPTVEAIACRVVYPAYTGEAPESRDLRNAQVGGVLAGSRLVLDINATKPIAEARLQLHLADGNMTSLRATSISGRQLVAEFNATLAEPLVSAFSIQLRDTDGKFSRDETRYALQVHADAPPVVVILAPADDDEVTRHARPNLVFTAEDLYGITGLTLHYRVENLVGEPGQTTGQIKLDPRKSQYEWDFETQMADLKRAILSVASVSPVDNARTIVTYWLEATDNNVVTGPGVGRSNERHFEIVSVEEKLAALRRDAEKAIEGVDKSRLTQDELRRLLELYLRQKAEQKPPGGVNKNN